MIRSYIHPKFMKFYQITSVLITEIIVPRDKGSGRTDSCIDSFSRFSLKNHFKNIIVLNDPFEF